MTTALFSDVNEQARKMRERNDCAVKAIALATETDYNRAHTYASKRGRRKGCGTHLHIIKSVVEQDLGYPMERVNLSHNWTVNQIEQSNAWKDGYAYLVLTSGHMLTVIDGVVHDWSKGSKRRVKMAWRIKQVGNVAPAPQPKPAPAPAPAPVAPKPARKVKKWERTLELARKGATVEDVAADLGISNVAARSQLVDLRRRGYNVSFDKATQRYTAL